MLLSDQWAGRVHHVNMLNKGMIHILGGTVQITYTTQNGNLKLMTCFWNFSLSFFGPQLIMSN